jgi:hypothetical protein
MLLEPRRCLAVFSPSASPQGPIGLKELYAKLKGLLKKLKKYR